FFQAEDGIRDFHVTGVQTCALPISTVSRFGKTDTLDVIKAEILVDLDRKEEAETTLMPWFRENSGIRQVYSTLGYLYLDKKNVKQAIQVLDRGLKNTNDKLLYLYMAVAYTVV